MTPHQLIKTLLLWTTSVVLAQVPAPWLNQDIGTVDVAGTASESGGTFTISASGADIWSTSDEFHFVHQSWTGDLQLTARVATIGNTNVWAKAGVMIRESLDANSAFAMTIISEGNGRRFQSRVATGNTVNNSGRNSAVAPEWVRLVRLGNEFQAFGSEDGNNWTLLGEQTINIDATVEVGLCLTAHDDGEVNTSTFDNITLEEPPEPEPPVEPIAGSGDGYFPLFNGSDFTNWYTFLGSGVGLDNDPDGIFKVEGGQIHLLDLDSEASNQPFGYFSTNDEYRNYRLRFEYRWGTKKYAPRATALRDSGVLYHFIGEDKVWPLCAESQVQEGDTGDFFMLAGAGVDSTQAASGNFYEPAGTPVERIGNQQASEVLDNLTDWNQVDIIVTEDEGIHVVNGFVNNRGTNLATTRNADTAVALDEGRIAFQVEGAEIFYRNIEVKPHFATGGGPDYEILVFSKTAGFRHGSISSGQEAIQAIGDRNNFTATLTEDSTVFNDTDLAKYACVVFLNTTGNILNAGQEAAFERYIQAGGGFVGIHSATDTEYGWAWYGELVGAYFDGHPAIQHADVCICDSCHPSTSSLGTDWMRRDEWYNFDPDPTDNPNITILVTVDETSYNGGTMGESHPITWCQEYDGGRSWYTAMGHTNESFQEPLFQVHLLGGIEWAAGKSSKATSDKTLLFDGSDTSAWETASNGDPIAWPILDDGSLQVSPGEGNIVTSETYQDFRLHLEFRPNTTAVGTAEQDRGNSGVYLQGRYEIQILDSFNDPLEGANDCAAIYNVKSADSNQAWPADAWQHYDIWFRAPRWEGNTKVENARVTVFWNGVLVHNNVEISSNTLGGALEGPTDGPILLQDSGNEVRFRNVWLEQGATIPAIPIDFIQISDIAFDSVTNEVTLAWVSSLEGPFQIQGGSGGDLSNLTAIDPILPLELDSEVTSPATFTLPVSLQGEDAVFFQVTN